ncbi:hypothetical protein TD95_000233 [Thielaviopsis punctulata]|uniref:SAC3/GANP/THP3 conserved domain-containing protein n=1 Tax=Thielaviopsis punctulata TaxID=72032 RepID=A0A0F4ZD08_9PEZI|nr:hypothetical protein TD95_000233 [Thielaviopsis punctulata]
MPTFGGNGLGSASQAPTMAASQSPFGQPSGFGSGPAFGASNNPFQTGGSQANDSANNPFMTTTSTGGFGSGSASSNPFQTSSQPEPASNPFLTAPAQSSAPSSGFGKPSPFGAPSGPSKPVPPQPSAFGQPQSNGFGSATASKPSVPELGSQPRNAFGSKAFTKPALGQPNNQNSMRPSQSNTASAVKTFAKPVTTGFSSSNALVPTGPKAADVQLGANAEPMNIQNPYAKRIYQELMANNIYPPIWPSDPGNPANKGTMANFREQYKAYRDKARAALVKAALIDDPDTRRKLSEAIEFKGICEDMCPDYEKMIRITEYDIKLAEKDPNTGFPIPGLMVKKLARSAAGQEAPLPMDVRSVACIRRSVDYLLDDLMKTEENLPQTHGFLWDRTRAIRRDFAFFSTLNKEEMLDQIYCFETITRFHVTALHLMSKPGFAPEDFSEQQEVEQLGKSLLSLIYAYDDCRAQNIVCPNEAEFRAYYLVLRAFDTNILDVLESEWSIGSMIDTPVIQTAVSILQSLKSPRDPRGPIRLGPGSVTAPFCSFFDVVCSAEVSFTMACFAEIHFGRYRRAVLRGLTKAFSRPKVGPAKDITADLINSHLRFDTVEECIDFVELHGLSFTPDADVAPIPGERELVAQAGQSLDHPRLKNAFSRSMVDVKRGSHPLPYLIRNAVYHEGISMTTSKPTFTPKPNTLSPPTALSQQNGTSAFGSVKQSQPFSSSASSTPFCSVQTAPTPTFGGFGNTAQNPTPASNNAFTSTSAAPAAAFTTPFGSLNKPTFGSLAQPSPAQTSLLSQSQQPSSTPSFSFGAKPALPATSTLSPATPTAASSTTASIFDQPKKTPSVFGSSAPAATSSSFSFSSNNAAPAPASTTSFGVSTPSSNSPANPSILNNTSGQAGTAAKAPMQNSPFAFGKPTLTPTPSFTSKSDAQIPAAATTSTPTFPSNPFGTTSAAPVPAATPFASNPPASGFSFPATQAPLNAFQQISQPPFGSLSELNPTAKLAYLSGTSTTPAPKPPVDKKAVLDGFARWYTLGDDGLLQQFQLYVTEEIVKDTFNAYCEQQKREEEEAISAQNLAKAVKFRNYNLSVRYFYKWRRTVRERIMEALRRSGREQLRAYQEAQREERRKAEALKRKTKDRVGETESTRMFHEVAERSLRHLMDVDSAMDISVISSVDEIPPHKAPRLLVGSTWSVPDAPEPTPKAKKAKRKKDNVAMPPPPVPQARRSQSVSSTISAGGKTQSIIEQYAMSRSASLRRSMPPGGSTNMQFARSQFSTPPVDGSPPEKRVSKLSDRWRLKAMGLTTMPDGSVLPDRMAHQMLYQRKHYNDMGSHSLSNSLPSTATRPRRVSTADMDMRVPRAKALAIASPRSGSVNRVPSLTRAAEAEEQRRKRSAEEALGSATETQNVEPLSATKKILLEAQRIREELKAMRSEIQKGTEWMHEESTRICSESPARY